MKANALRLRLHTYQILTGFEQKRAHMEKGVRFEWISVTTLLMHFNCDIIIM